MLDFSDDEWSLFTTVEKRIVILVRKDGINSKEKIREILMYPLAPMKEVTFRGHWARIQRKIERIRNARSENV